MPLALKKLFPTGWFLLAMPWVLLLVGCGAAPEPKKQGRFTSGSEAPAPSAASFAFSTISSMSGKEGSTILSDPLGCTSSESTSTAKLGLTKVEPVSVNCSLTNISPYRISCTPPIVHSHAPITATLTVNCTISGSEKTQDVTLTVLDKNLPPDLTSHGNQTLLVGDSATPVNVNDGTDDFDVEGDPITYACTFTGGGVSTATDCSAVPGAGLTFTASSGIFSWSPGHAAVPNGSSESEYIFTITGSDNQTPAGTDSLSFNMTVIRVGPAPPTFVSVTPNSPNNSSIAPLVKGAVSPDTVNVNLYLNDPTCSSPAATGTAATFISTGIALTVPANTSTAIYAASLDSSNTKSSCASMVTYVHDTEGPPGPTFFNTSPVSPSNSNTPNVRGNASADTVTIDLYSDSSCSILLSSGSRSAYTGAGIGITVTDNSTTNIYAVAYDALNNQSACTSLATYINDKVPPSSPGFTSINPASPNSDPSPKVIGTTSGDTVTVNIYSDSGCTSSIGTGTGVTFVSTGISSSITTNATTTIYAKAMDGAGNLSSCSFMVNYAHDNIGPADPTFSSINPTSPSASNTTPMVIGAASAETATIKIYDNNTCTNQIGSDTKANFEGAGVQATVTANSTSSLYATAFDSLGNAGSCVLMTTYTHDNAGPTNPTFVSATPASPSSNASPAIKGTASGDTATVTLYSNIGCSASIGSGTRAAFVGSGITASVTTNNTTTIYAKAFDSLNNASSCVSMTSYIHDNVVPGNPAFSSTNPASPTSATNTPLVIGTASVDTATITLYSDAGCATSIGSGIRADWVGSGIVATCAFDATTTVYAKAFDSAGNGSACTNMTSFTHDSAGPAAPTFTSTDPASPSNSTTPKVIGSASADTVTVKIYDDSGCTNELASNTKATFQGAGIQVTVAANATTNLYAKAFDGSAAPSQCASMTAYLNDSVNPNAVLSVLDGSYFSSLTTTPTVSWSAGSDNGGGSGVASYDVSIGTSAGATDIKTWTNVGNVTTTSFGSLSLSNGTTYFTNVRVMDAAGNTGSVTSSDGWVVDNTAPSNVVVTASLATATRLTGSWTSSSDAQSGLANYSYSIGTSAGATDIKTWTLVSNATTSVDVNSGITLTIGTIYYLNVKAINNAGGESAVSSGNVEAADLTQNLKAFFKFENGSNIGEDTGLLGNHLTAQNSVAQVSGGVLNNAADLVPNSPTNYLYYNCSTNCPFSVNATTRNFTVSLWVKFDTLSAERMILSKTDGNSGVDEYYITRRTQAGGTLRFSVNGANFDINGASYATSTGTWYHIVAWYDAGAASEINMTITQMSSPATTYTGAANQDTDPSQQTSQFRIGEGNAGVTHDGQVDLVGFWDRALTLKERNQLYNSNGSVGQGREPPFY